MHDKQLRKIINKMAELLADLLNIAQSGTTPAALHTSTSSSPWVIYTGATDHMAGTPHSFSLFYHSSDLGSVKLADGHIDTNCWIGYSTPLSISET